MKDRNFKISIEQLRKQINTNNVKIKNYKDINCYAYALGLDIKENEIFDGAYEPGAISGANNLLFSRFTYNELLYWLYEDLKLLNIEYCDSYPDELIQNNEWKIAIFTEKLYCLKENEYLRDYHFLRESKSGIWYHKLGWDSQPTNKDSNYKVIKNVEECCIGQYTYKKCLKLKLK